MSIRNESNPIGVQEETDVQTPDLGHEFQANAIKDRGLFQATPNAIKDRGLKKTSN